MKKIRGILYKTLIICCLLLFSVWKSAASELFFSAIGGQSCAYTALSAPEDSLKKSKKSQKAQKNNAPFSKRKGRVTFETFDANYARAVYYYNNRQYLSAAKLFEELYPLSLGTAHADTILFMFADCYFQNRDYEMAAFHFKDYARRYPSSDRAELASLMAIKAVYNLSPYYALDQSETIYAIDELNTFISLYPHSQYMDECNKMLDVLRNKLAKKDFELLKLYFNTENYRAAQIATDNFLKTYAYSQYAPEAAFILVKNNYQYAKKSVKNKMKERYEQCIMAYDNLVFNFPESPLGAEAVKYRDEAKKQIEKLNKHNK
ncbi:MAG: outer membrane protein assembly factor BamD [Bacteroidales bacterium]|nr:outer membrane protein assembly factor BamD [Bacteroidales bacterium]